MRFAIGAAVVDVIVDDDDYRLPLAGCLPGLDAAALARHRAVLEPEFVDLAGDALRVAVQSYVVRVGDRTILIDSCIGDDRDRPQVPVWDQRHNTGFLDRMRRAGTDLATVDIVFCTHLHVDHVGWNTRLAHGRFVPTFPNARYLFGRAELADWMAQCASGTVPALHGAAIEDSVAPILEAGRADLVDDGHELAPGFTRCPATPPARWASGWIIRPAAPSSAPTRYTPRCRSTSRTSRPPGDPGAFPWPPLRPCAARGRRVRAGLSALCQRRMR